MTQEQLREQAAHYGKQACRYIRLARKAGTARQYETAVDMAYWSARHAASFALQIRGTK